MLIGLSYFNLKVLNLSILVDLCGTSIPRSYYLVYEYPGKVNMLPGPLLMGMQSIMLLFPLIG